MGGDWDRVETGAPDVHRFRTAHRVATTHEPLVGEAAFDSTVDPQTLQLSMKAGIQADTGRFDVTWTDAGYYRSHYTEVSPVRVSNLADGMGFASGYRRWQLGVPTIDTRCNYRSRLRLDGVWRSPSSGARERRSGSPAGGLPLGGPGRKAMGVPGGGTPRRGCPGCRSAPPLNRTRTMGRRVLDWNIHPSLSSRGNLQC